MKSILPDAAHGEIEVLDFVAGLLEHRESQVKLERHGTERGNRDEQARTDRDSHGTQLVIGGDSSEVGEEDLMEGVAGVPRKLILHRRHGHHDASRGYVESVRTD